MEYYKEDLLSGKLILITGGGSGLGLAMAKKFLRLGARVVICGRREDVLNQAVDEIGSDRIGMMRCDVKDIHQVAELMSGILDKWGEVDILVNNAAANFISPTEDLTPNAFRVINDTVYLGTVNCVMTFGKHWIEVGRKACVLNIVTGYATNGTGFVVPSACSKAAVQVLTKSLAVEWAKYRIRFVGIAPGQFPTEGAFGRLLPDESLVDLGLSKIPSGRFGDPAELANLAAYLVSDVADYITGEIVHIDGGFGLNLQGELNPLDILTKEQWKEIKNKVRKKRT